MQKEQLVELLQNYAEAIDHAHIEGIYISGREIKDDLKQIAEWVKADPSEVPSIDDCRETLNIHDNGIRESYWIHT